MAPTRSTLTPGSGAAEAGTLREVTWCRACQSSASSRSYALRWGSSLGAPGIGNDDDPEASWPRIAVGSAIPVSSWRCYMATPPTAAISAGGPRHVRREGEKLRNDAEQ